MDVLDESFDSRRFNMGWAEHKMQYFFNEMAKKDQRIKVHWESIQAPPKKLGENQSNLPDSGYIGMYICLKFGNIGEG
jgi:hypothetical protein